MTKCAHHNQGCRQAKEQKELTAFVSVIMGSALIYFVLGSDDEDASDDMVKLLVTSMAVIQGLPMISESYSTTSTNLLVRACCMLSSLVLGHAAGVIHYCCSRPDDPDFIPNKADFFRLFSVAAVTYKALDDYFVSSQPDDDKLLKSKAASFT